MTSLQHKQAAFNRGFSRQMQRQVSDYILYKQAGRFDVVQQVIPKAWQAVRSFFGSRGGGAAGQRFTGPAAGSGRVVPPPGAAVGGTPRAQYTPYMGGTGATAPAGASGRVVPPPGGPAATTPTPTPGVAPGFFGRATPYALGGAVGAGVAGPMGASSGSEKAQEAMYQKMRGADTMERLAYLFNPKGTTDRVFQRV